MKSPVAFVISCGTKRLLVLADTAQEALDRVLSRSFFDDQLFEPKTVEPLKVDCVIITGSIGGGDYIERTLGTMKDY